MTINATTWVKFVVRNSKHEGGIMKIVICAKHCGEHQRH